MKNTSLLLSVFLASCASISVQPITLTEGKPQAELLVFREPAFLAGGMGLYFGESEKYFFVLDNAQYSRIKINAGRYIFQAKAHASPAFELEVDAKAESTTCIKGKANPTVAGAVLIPFLGNMISSFMLEQVDCPNDDALKAYKLKESS